jgi:putative ABC transport system substrate-binding protein
MKRREFITLLGSAAASWPLKAWGQQTGMPVIGILSFTPENPRFTVAFRQGLFEAGYVLGQNVAIEFRSADNKLSLLPQLAADLVDRKVAVIVTTASAYAAVAAKEATSTIPIVFTLGDDPVKYGLVTSLSRPGGNVTGMTFLTGDLAGKRLNLLRDLIPEAIKVGYLSLPPIPGAPVIDEMRSDMFAAGRALGREIILSEVRGFDYEAAFTTLVQQRVGALIVGGFTVFLPNRKKIVELAAHHKIAAAYPDRQYVVAGGLMSYGAGGHVVRFLARNYVGQILKGAKPADLPVQQPTQFDLVINLKTAKALGLTIPRTLFATATELIE